MLLDLILAVRRAGVSDIEFDDSDPVGSCVKYSYEIISDDGAVAVADVTLRVYDVTLAAAEATAETLRTALVDEGGRCLVPGGRVTSVTLARSGEARRGRFGQYVVPVVLRVTGRSASSRKLRPHRSYT